MMKHNEQFAIVKREWYDKLPADQQKKVDMNYIEMVLIDFQERLESETESHMYVTYTNLEYAAMVDGWIRLIYPDACTFANEKVQYICLNSTQLKTLLDKMRDKVKRYRDAVFELNRFVYAIETKLEPLEVFS